MGKELSYRGHIYMGRSSVISNISSFGGRLLHGNGTLSRCRFLSDAGW